MIEYSKLVFLLDGRTDGWRMTGSLILLKKDGDSQPMEKNVTNLLMLTGNIKLRSMIKIVIVANNHIVIILSF